MKIRFPSASGSYLKVNSVNILVVDDEPVIRAYLRELLEDFDCRVFDTGESLQAIPMIREHSIDIVFTDIIMPEKKGIELIPEIKKLFPGMTIIAMSGAPDSDLYLTLSRQLGVEATLVKPFPSYRIRELLDNLSFRSKA